MPNAGITVGCRVIVEALGGIHLQKIATSEVVRGYDFLVVWACREEEWLAARAAGREPDAMPWPAETVTAIIA